MKKLLFLLIIGCLLLTLPSLGRAVIIERIVAVVNGQIITLSELQELEYFLRTQEHTQEDETPKKKNPEITSTLLDQLIDKKLQLQLAATKKITVSEQHLQDALEDIKRQNKLTTDSELKKILAQQGMTIESFTSQLKENIQITILVRRELSSQVEINEKEIVEYYQKHQTYFSYLDELRAQHILFYLPAEAAPEQIRTQKELAHEVWQKLQAGADFAQLAKQHSADPSAKKGGDLGYFRKGEMLPALENAALKLNRGEISPVLQTHFGFHIIKLTERRHHTLQNDPKIKEEIKQTLYQQKSEKQLKKWLKELRRQAKIKTML